MKAKSTSGSPAVESTSTKRGRGKNAAKSVSDDEEEEDVGSRKKKKRLSTTASSSKSNGANCTNKKSSLSALNKAGSDDVEMPDIPTESPETSFTTMKALKYNAIKSWEDLVQQITTIERSGPQGELMVYFET